MIQGKPLEDYQPPPPLFPLDEDENSEADENQVDSDESEGEIDASRTRSGRNYRDDDQDDDELYIPRPLPAPPPQTNKNENHPSRVIGVETANDAPEEGIQLEPWADLPEIGQNEGDDQSDDSLQVSEPDVDVPEVPTTQAAPETSRPEHERNPPDFLSPRMTGQYHGILARVLPRQSHI